MGKYSKDLSDRFSNRGPETGYCAICRAYGPLTKDHVPPKNCGNVRDSVMRGVFPDQAGRFSGRVISQGGSHFRTICGGCNSGLLGVEYDPALSDVVRQVEQLIRSAFVTGLALPDTHLFDYKPNRFVRSVLGHLLAANAVDELTKDDLTSKVAPLDAALRAFVLDPCGSLPDNVDVYYWLYPDRRRVIVKHAAMGWFGNGGQIIYGHVFKFFPFGFWIVQHESPTTSYRISLPTINADLSADIDACARLLVPLAPLQKLNFPEAPPDDGMWLISDRLASQAIDRPG